MLKILVAAALFIVSLFANLKTPAVTPGAKEDGGVCVRYGGGVCNFMDVYLPETAAGEVNVFFYVHGGAWMKGDHTGMDGLARGAAKRGFVGVTVDYDKLIHNASAADMTEDLLEACRTLRSYMEERGLTPGRMAIVGHSSGGHLALLYAYGRCAESPIPVAFAAVYAAPTDLMLRDGKEDTSLEKYRHLAATALSRKNMSTLAEKCGFRSVEEGQRLVSPVYLVTPAAPPTLIFHGTADTEVPCANAERLYQRLTECGVPARLVLSEGEGHNAMWEAGEENKRLQDEALREWTELYF